MDNRKKRRLSFEALETGRHAGRQISWHFRSNQAVLLNALPTVITTRHVIYPLRRFGQRWLQFSTKRQDRIVQ